ncbi:oligosaccharide flippase family protein [Leptolyngbya sp. FACHB-261]|uniref:oligosaccharide flippase family protein n=1 Tax=Leptolyngbya sp. FACHB-261 TaxID=2692806 RepID=UPI0016871F83|nr:oligosaccharide flippase family protein [Leptolyngbya sp. FACHB-261]MBD2105042.1 oligosaccharide flippase family protein [Leptolyngbya sp. FACHB-261]
MSLRTQVLRGGTYLAVRQGLGMGLSLVGVVFLTRTIGPEAYGLYATTYSLYNYLYTLSQWGISICLIRREGEAQRQDYDQAFTLLLLLGVVAGLVALLALPWLAWWVRLEGFRPLALAMICGLPLNLLTLVPLARLERELDYRQVALIELAGQATSYAVAIPLAFQGWGAWSLIGGWWVQQLLSCLLLYRAAKYRPAFYWNLDLAREMVSYGLGYSASMWIWQLRSLVNPLVVGRFAGAEAVGYVALAIRWVEVLSFVRNATWRISLATLARLQGDRQRLAAAITEGMRLQVLALGPFLLGFALVSPWLLPVVFGETWLPVLTVYPFIALSYLVNTVFNLHSSALYVLRHNWQVTIFHAVHIALFVGAAILLVPRLGPVGYGWAEVVTLLSYIVIHIYTVRAVGWPDYGIAVAWVGGFALALFWRDLGWGAGVGLLAIALWPQTWRVLGGYMQSLRKVQHG